MDKYFHQGRCGLLACHTLKEVRRTCKEVLHVRSKASVACQGLEGLHDGEHDDGSGAKSERMRTNLCHGNKGSYRCIDSSTHSGTHFFTHSEARHDTRHAQLSLRAGVVAKAS